MPLLRLEVENFKSYRGKQIIGPFRSFNSVIGPNGSGKSNLMDAISFVLGVKSSQLRSSQLKELIYRGRRLQRDGEMDLDRERGDEDTSDAEDAGQGGSARKATVTAVYQDRKGAEHLFTRTVNMSGSSEYRVNGKAVSASAYNDHLKSFNILVKAKNFLVFQGDVEAVASQNPKDLSRLIDQISGSLEHKDAYDRAKAASDRARENAAFIFNKRRNVNSELKHFKEQKNEADRFKRIQRERDEHVIRHLLWQLFHSERAIREKTTLAEKNAARIPGLRTRVEQAEAALEKQRQQQGQTAQQILEEQRSLRKREKECERLQPDVDGVEQKMKHSQRKTASSEEIVTSVQADIVRYEDRVAKYASQYEQAKDAAERAAREQAQASAASGLNLSEDDLRQYQDLRSEANMRARSERQQIETLSMEMRAQRGAMQTLEDKIADAQAQKERLDVEAQTLDQRKADGQRRRELVRQRLSDVRSSVRALHTRRDEIQRRMDEVNRTLQTCLQQLVEAGHVQRETEREARMRDTVATLRKLYPGVLGRMVDLCKPTQRKYDVAIQTVLGKNGDAIVVETQKEAIECIDYLKRQRLGQATFIPLDTAQAKEINERLRSIADGARLAIDILQFQSTIERAIRYACGNAVICDDLAIARSVAYEKNQQVKVVTIDGTVIHKSGLMTGGRTADASGHRWQDREVEGLKKQRDDCLAELKSLGAEQYELARTADDSAKVKGYETELSATEDELKIVTSRLKDIEAERSALERQVKAFEPQQTVTQQKINDLQKRSNIAQRAVDREDDEIFAAFCHRIGVSDIRQYEDRQLSLIQRQKEARAEFELQMKRLQLAQQFEQGQLDAARQRHSVNEGVVKREKGRLDELQKARDELFEKLENVRTEIGEIRDRIEELRVQEHSGKSELAEVRIELQKAQSTLDEVIKDSTSANLAIEKLADDRTAIYRRCRLEEIDLPLERGSLNKVPLDDANDEMDLDEDDEEAGAQSVVDYGIQVRYDLLTAQDKRDGGKESGQDLEQRIKDANAELERMAAPNAKTMDRLDDSENRLADADVEFERARRNAKKAQDEFLRLKKLRSDLYHQAFEHISGKVNEVYEDLTRSRAAPKGGRAFLDLQNESEPYLEGVLYTAMPPTKSFRGIDQLSGGEKSVAALALLFAIHSYRPAPFFVLDEVDAALDANNVARVASYIRSRASPDFQFIVISLKATLYERSEALLGVMRKQDINSSRTLTLDLEQYA